MRKKHVRIRISLFLSFFSWLSLFLLAVSFPGYGQEPPRGKALHDLILKGGLVTGGRAPQVTWLPDGNAYLVLEKFAPREGKVFVKVDPETLDKSEFFDFEEIQAAYAAFTGKPQEGLPFTRFTLSEDGSRVGFGSFTNGYTIYDREEKRFRQFKPIQSGRPAPKRSPDWSKAAYVKNYDLHVMDLESGEETRLTEGGCEELMNGRPDWVYPEELDQHETYWWSPDGGRIAFLRFDERPVTQFPLVKDLAPRGELELERYPKAGDANPVVTLHIVDVATRKITDVDMGPDKDVYIIRGKWFRDGSALTFQRLSRLQNVLELLAADPDTGRTRVLLREEEDCFINVTFDLTFLENSPCFLWTSERSGWRQIYLYDLKGNLVKQLTHEELPVGSISEVDEERGWVYFTGYRNMGLDSHLFRVGLDGEGFKRLTSDPGSHRASLAPKGRYFFDSYSSIEKPTRVLFCRGDGSVIRVESESNTEKLEALGLAPAELFSFKAAGGETILHGMLFKPADLDPAKKYPLMNYVYGGPHSKAIRNRFSDTSLYQAIAQLGYIVIRLDNRGTTSRGKVFETATYLKLGQVDLADQVAGVKHVATRPYVDANRVGITGGSYGGYMTCMALLAAPDVFHVGVAVSSVTDWRNYDTIYTERYMRRPKDNPDGYDKGAALTYAGNLEGKLFLVHGSIDDNVHWGNSSQLVQKLVEADKDFDLMIYPEQRHGIRGAGSRHLRRLTAEYLARHLRPEPGL